MARSSLFTQKAREKVRACKRRLENAHRELSIAQRILATADEELREAEALLLHHEELDAAGSAMGQ